MAYVLFGGPVSASPDHALSAISAGANEADGAAGNHNSMGNTCILAASEKLLLGATAKRLHDRSQLR